MMYHQPFDPSELPMGFGMALARNLEAMERFSNMSDEQKRLIIEGTHNIDSKVEMRRYVNSLAWR